MKSLLLTVLYLAKDTVHRWMARLSSPLARVLVVFFLSLCALVALGSFAISAKVIRDRILREGGDLVHAIIFTNAEHPLNLPTEPQLQELLDADSFALQNLGNVRIGERRSISLFTYDFRRSGQLMPYLEPGGGATLLCTAAENIPEGPIDVSFSANRNEELRQTVMVRHLPEESLLARLLPRGGVVISPETAADLMGGGGSATQMILRLRHPDNAGSLIRTEQYIRTLCRLEGVNGATNSAARLMGEMDILLSNQVQCRAAFCLGIVMIVGILLTALAGIEYRQNEYIYTLMKSFGIHPLLLVASFVAENAALVSLSFGAAVLVFLHIQDIILREFFKLSGYALSLSEIMPEMQLIAATLGLCVLVSALPVMAAANREIGRVLK